MGARRARGQGAGSGRTVLPGRDGPPEKPKQENSRAQWRNDCWGHLNHPLDAVHLPIHLPRVLDGTHAPLQTVTRKKTIGTAP